MSKFSSSLWFSDNEIKEISKTSTNVFTCMGASNHAIGTRQVSDYYATDPHVLFLLLEQEKFSNNVWECACGGGHLSEVLSLYGHTVKSTDLIDRGYKYGEGGVDFLKQTTPFNGDIITNPPYKYALEFVKKALELIPNGNKVAMLLRIQFLEGKDRRKFFDETPPARVYVSSSRIACAKNGDFTRYTDSSAMCFAWFVWEKGKKTEPIIRWFN